MQLCVSEMQTILVLLRSDVAMTSSYKISDSVASSFPRILDVAGIWVTNKGAGVSDTMLTLRDAVLLPAGPRCRQRVGLS